MSRGTSLHWKTGSINERREEAELKRESWIGGGENFFDETSKTTLPFSMMKLPERITKGAGGQSDPFENIE